MISPVYLAVTIFHALATCNVFIHLATSGCFFEPLPEGEV